MSLLAAPLEREQLEALRERYPEFRGELPEEAKFWTEADINHFLGSGGDARPPERAQKALQTCPLLSRLRLKLAEERVSEPTAEYRSFCRHFKESRDSWKLSSVAECLEVPRCRAIPDDFRVPVVVEKQRDWKARLWNMDFWGQQCGEEARVCHARSPRLQDEASGMDAFAVEATVAEFVEYARLVHRMDRKCAEENSLSYPRVHLHGWTPFCERMLPLFAGCWKELAPPGVKDLTGRWVQLFAQAFDADWLAALARFYPISIRSTGAFTRLHLVPHGAHLWANQIEGRSVYFLFAPQEAPNLYTGHSLGESPVDVFFPSAKRHARFAEAKAQSAVLYLGQTIVIPSGWWWCSVALEPSVTISHLFWNMDNKVHFTDALRENFEFAMPDSRSAAKDVAMNLQHIHQQVMEDEDSDMDD